MRISAVVGDEEIFAECDSELASMVEQMLALMAQQSRQGHPVFEGMRIEFGWTTFTLKRHAKKLFLHEPIFDQDPSVDLRRDLTCSIDVYLEQQKLIHELGLSQWRPARWFDELVAAHGVLSEPSLIAKHYADSEGETGWVLFHSEDSRPLTLRSVGKQYGKLLVWQLLSERPGLLRYLALPTGFMVFLRDDTAEKIINEAGDA